MSREHERQTVIAHFLSVWLTADGEVAIMNQPFTTPLNELFADVKIVETGTFRKSLGRTFIKRHNGVLQVDLYSPFGTGVAKSRQIADRLEDVYEELILPVPGTVESIKFGTPSSSRLATNVQRAENLDDNWDRYTFQAPYYRDQYVEK